MQSPCGGKRNSPWSCAPGGVSHRCRRRPTLPRPLGRSTIGAVGLNDRVRDGNGCGPYALVASENQGVSVCRLTVRRTAAQGEHSARTEEPTNRSTDELQLKCWTRMVIRGIGLHALARCNTKQWVFCGD